MGSMIPEVVKRNKTLNLSLNLALLFWLGQLGMILFAWQRLPPQVPLFYSQPWGEEQLTAPVGLLLLPTTSLLVIAINTLMAVLIVKKAGLLKELLMIFAAVFSFLCFFTLLKIVFLIT